MQQGEINKRKLNEMCKLAVDNIIRESITDVDIFNKPFEIEYLLNEDNRSVAINTITTAIVSALSNDSFSELKVKKIGHVLFPKKSLSDYRRCALIDVYDEIIYLTLVLYIVKAIEKNRISKKNNIVFSYRFKKNEKISGLIFDPKYNYTAFRNQYLYERGQEDNNVMVSCDIANFYDRINIHRIESVLLSMLGVDQGITELINELLLFWSNRDSYGLPVGSNASRILAEALLTDVDNYLLSRGIKYCRFVDDFRIFAKDAYEAHSALALLSECLAREGLFLNASKTAIEDISDISVEKNANEIADDSEVNDEEDSIKFEKGDRLRIIRGYSGLVPTRFRRPSNSFAQKYKDFSIKEKYTSLAKKYVIDPRDIRELISIIYVQKNYEYYSKLPMLLKSYPQFIPYYVSALSKTENLPKDIVDSISNELVGWFNDAALPEYIQVYIIRLLGSEPFAKTDLLIELFRKLKRNSGDYVGRALLEEMYSNLDRPTVLEIKEYYYRADIWERRAILRIVKNYLPEAEQNPFYKNIEFHNDDIFTTFIMKKDSLSKEKKKKK